MKNASKAVILVREYLLKNKPSISNIELRTVGPTPFHAELYVTRDDKSNFSINERVGYDEIFFAIPSSIESSDLSEYYDEIFDGTTAEIGIFYEIMQSCYRLREGLSEISREIRNTLESIDKRRYFIDRIKNIFAAPKISSHLISLIEYDMEVSSNSLHFDEAISFKERGGSILFRLYIDRAMDDLRSISTQELHKIATVVSDYNKEVSGYRVALIAILSGFLSAIIGGVVGSLVSIGAGL